MAYTYEQVFAADPSNPSNVAQNASITIFAPGDGTMTPLTITDPDGQPLSNPIPVNANGFGSAFAHATLDRVAWAGGGFTGYFTSYEGMKQVALDAQAAAEQAAANAGAEATAVAEAAIGEATVDAAAAATSAASAEAAATAAADAAAASAALVGAPADTAIAAAVNGSGATKTALTATVLAQTEPLYAKLGSQKMRGPIDPRTILAPGAPLDRKTAATPPTVAIATTNPQASGRQVPFFSTTTGLVNTKHFGLAAGADWRPTSAGAISGWANQTGLTGSTNTFSPAAVILGFDGTVITFMLKSNNSHRYRIRVDGEYVDPLDTTGPGGATTQYLTLTFATAKPREIRFEQVNGFFYGVYVGTNDTLPWAIKPRGPRIALLGDSYSAGDDPTTGGYSAFTSGIAIAADRLGWGDLINGAIAGTGWITRVGVNNNIQDKVAQLITWAPDVVIIATGHNDLTESTANITAAVTTSLNAIRAGLPNVPIIVIGPLFAGGPVDGTRDTTWGPIQDAMFAGVLPEHRAVTIDTASAGIFTGTGKTGTPGTGNGNTYMQAETIATHPTRAGADYLSERLTRSLLTAIAAL